MLILFYLLLYIKLLETKIVIKDSGLATISRGDMAMILYVTVENLCESNYHIYAKMVKCCEVFAPNDMDCRTMQLIGGDMGWLAPHSAKNISLISPTLYLHNRFGHCLVSITYNSSETSVNIQFNTLITQFTAELLDYCGDKNTTQCDTVDLDPLSECEPVNCQMKYLGARNYFNCKWRRCQKVPLCVADPDKSLPDVSYVPLNNQCRDLEDINLKDLQELQQDLWRGEVGPRVSVTRPQPNIRCNHGKMNEDSGFCTCDDGWTTTAVDGNQYEPTLAIYHMCNTEIIPVRSKAGHFFYVVFVTGASIALLLLLTSFLCHLSYSCYCGAIRQLTVTEPISNQSQFCNCCRNAYESLPTQTVGTNFEEQQPPIVASEDGVSYPTTSIQQISDHTSEYTTEEELSDF
ncbi:hypothetical protein PPYR_12771 [Photinus pyralis]|uniref:EGF-like domain-containing protein n=1 Tax=Photinus pyralis TaxID=7054 RepID=A0A5N4A759_PHOPY|nr:hypothetical protein PPYR_12771 [Photinus pyralis]